MERHNNAGTKAREIIDETKQDLENAVNTSYDFESMALARLNVIQNPSSGGKVFYTNGKAVRDHVSTLCIEQSTGYDNMSCHIPVGTEVTIIGSIDNQDSKEYIFRTNTPETVYFPMGEASVKQFISCGEHPSQNEKRYVCRFMPKE